MTRLNRLRAYIDAVAERAPVIGVDDCGPWVAAWLAQECGVTLAFAPYTTREAGDAMVNAEGGLAAYVAARIGLPETDAPEPGDVGVIAFTNREVAGIFATGDHVYIRGEHKGAFPLRARGLIKAWRLP